MSDIDLFSCDHLRFFFMTRYKIGISGTNQLNNIVYASLKFA